MRRGYQVALGACFAVIFGALASGGLNSLALVAPHEGDPFDLRFDRTRLAALDISDGTLHVRLEVVDSRWTMKDPVVVSVDQARIEGLIAAFAKPVGAVREVPHGETGWENDAAYGLDRRKTRVDLLAEDTLLLGLELGDTLPSGERYVRLSGHRSIYLARMALLGALDRRAEAWFSPAVLPFAPDVLETLEVVSDRGEASVEWEDARPVYRRSGDDQSHGLTQEELIHLRFNAGALQRAPGTSEELESLRASLEPGALRVRVRTEGRGIFQLRAGPTLEDGRRIVQIGDGEPALVTGYSLDVFERLVR